MSNTTDDSNTLDGIPQHIPTTMQELDLAADPDPADAGEQVVRVLRMYALMASRPRKAHSWAWMQSELWNARQDALRSGSLRKYRNDGSFTDDYEFITARITDCDQRREMARHKERDGHPDFRC